MEASADHIVSGKQFEAPLKSLRLTAAGALLDPNQLPALYTYDKREFVISSKNEILAQTLADVVQHS